MPVVLTRVAESDIDRAMEWYEGRKEGLGAEFLLRVRETIKRIGLNPEGYARFSRMCVPRISGNFHTRFGTGNCKTAPL